MQTLYNEIDRYCCDWLSNLMDAGLITAGKIDDRRIEELEPDDVRGYERVHFFAGIAGWDLALRLAGWESTRPVWTGSCPCQPFSAAGQGKAADDERHLWPEWFKLIHAVRPPTVFGEQVESAIGWGWVDLVHADMATQGYATRFAVLPACGVGAPHIRNRLWFVAQSDNGKSDRELRHGDGASSQRGEIGRPSLPCELADADGGDSGAERLQRGGQQRQQSQDGGTGELADANTTRCGTGRAREAGNDGTARIEPAGLCDDELAHGFEPGWQGRLFRREDSQRRNLDGYTRLGDAIDHWADIEWVACSDGKARPAKPGIFPLAHGVPGRVGQLRAAGNSIIPQVAAEFIKATMTCG